MRVLAKLNTYYRLLLLIIGSSALFFLLFLSLYFYTVKQEKEVYSTASTEYTKEVGSIFELNSKTHIATIIDVTFWDELVTFMETKDSTWYKDYIDGEFSTYEVDYIGIYGLNQRKIFSSHSAKLNTEDIIPKALFAKLHNAKLLRFYMQLPEGMVEVFGATIHPSDDPKKIKHPPSGYFFMIRRLNKEFIQNLEKISSSTIRLAPKAYLSSNTRNYINVDLDLKDWQDKTISKIHFERAFNLNFNNTKKILGIILIATILNLLIYLFYYRRWIYKPLKLITNSLETKDEKSMSQLKKSHGEFVYIGNLFEENNKQRKQLEIAKQRAEESDNLKSAFLANLSHEIRTPMNAILGFSDLLNDESLSHSDKIEYLEIIRKSGKNLISIIEDLLEMSKIDSKQIAPNYTSLDLDKCISEVYNATRVTIPKEKNITFTIVKTTKSLKKNILMDEIKLKQILTNLLTNAIKFTISGHINIGCAVNEETKLIKIWVEDSGLGIDKVNTKLIFDRFRRVEDDFSIQLSGLGLGLSISKAYIELLGGTIAVKSARGVGSTFTINIPLIYDETTPKASIDKSSYQIESTTHKTILVAEDDDINFLLLEKILLLKNYHVIRAANGKVAVELCKDNLAIDLIFMDIKMPIMNGFEAFKMIRTFNQSIPIIANTAYSSPEDKEKIMNAGFTNYLSKPLNKEKIFDVLEVTFGNS